MGKRGQGEGSIYQRDDGRWVAQVSLDDGKRKYVYGKTRREVSEKLKVLLREQQQGTLVAGPSQTLEQFLKHWLDDVVTPTVRPGTAESYAQQVRSCILPTLGRVTLEKLDAQQLQALYTSLLKAGHAPGSVRRYHAILHRALAQAVRWNLVSRNVADLVDPPRSVPDEIAPLTVEQTMRLLDVARGDRLHALYVLAVTTGMRQSELLGLRWEDVDLASRRLHVVHQLLRTRQGGFQLTDPKTAKGRRAIALSALAVEALQTHREAQAAERSLCGSEWEERGLVFPNQRGRPIERGNLVRRSFRPLLKQAGLPQIRFHDLRHTAATLLLKQGTNPKVVQERLGHSTIAVTMNVYSHVLPDMQREAADALDLLLRRPGEDGTRGPDAAG